LAESIGASQKHEELKVEDPILELSDFNFPPTHVKQTSSMILQNKQIITNRD